MRVLEGGARSITRWAAANGVHAFVQAIEESTVTFVLILPEGGALKVQFVLRPYSSPAAVLYGFDITASQFGLRWDSTAAAFAFETTWLGKFAARTWTILDLGRTSPSYLLRIKKYMSLGFRLRLPELRRDFLECAPSRPQIALTVGTFDIYFRIQRVDGNLVHVTNAGTPKGQETDYEQPPNLWSECGSKLSKIQQSLAQNKRYIEGQLLSRFLRGGTLLRATRGVVLTPQNLKLLAKTDVGCLGGLEPAPVRGLIVALSRRIEEAVRLGPAYPVGAIEKNLGVPLGSPEMAAATAALYGSSEPITVKTARLIDLLRPAASRLQETGDAAPFRWWYEGHPSDQGRGTRNFMQLGPLGILGPYHRDSGVPFSELSDRYDVPPLDEMVAALTIQTASQDTN